MANFARPGAPARALRSGPPTGPIPTSSSRANPNSSNHEPQSHGGTVQLIQTAFAFKKPRILASFALQPLGLTRSRQNSKAFRGPAIRGIFARVDEKDSLFRVHASACEKTPQAR